MRAREQTASVEDPAAFAALGVDNAFDVEAWKQQLKIDVISLTGEEIVFDMVGTDAPLANALRRILLSEVSPAAPTQRPRVPPLTLALRIRFPRWRSRRRAGPQRRMCTHAQSAER